MEIQPGLQGRIERVVENRDTAAHLGSGQVQVLATPILVALLENAAVAAVDHLLPTGQQTVGIHVDIRHSAATPVGMKVTAHAELIAVDRRTLTFRVRAEDEKEAIGGGTHQRAIIDVVRFQEKVKAKATAKL